MANKVIMPKQGLQMTEGTITKWLVQEGQQAIEGESLFEMETDKLTIVIDSTYTGTLLKIIKDEGEVVPITEIIAIIGEKGEDISDILDAENDNDINEVKDTEIDIEVQEEKNVEKISNENLSNKRIFISPRAKKLANESDIEINTVKGTGTNGRIVEKDIVAYKNSLPKLTSTAKKMVIEKGLNPKDIKGSGIGGRIYRSDVEKLVVSKEETINNRGERVIPLNSMRKIIADRMCTSQREMAQTNHKIKVDASELIKIRETYKKDGIKISYNDIIVKMVSKALTEYPIINSSFSDEGIILKEYVNMGIAVAVDNGLIVPVIKDTDLMNIEQIGSASKEVIEKIKTGKLETKDYTGGTFTISNLGMYDIDEFVAIINPPEAGILAVGKMEYVPVVVDKTEIEIKPIIKLTLSYDHRTIDGADAAKFLSRIKQLLEKPYLAL